jgi:glycolate oxidase iron-sulfur subunit
MDSLSLMKRAGVSVKVIKTQQCCGTPMAASGDFATATRLMADNLEALLSADVDAVVVACATCGTALRDLYPNILSKLKPGLEEKAASLAAKTYDITELLTDIAPLPGKPALKKPMRVTYHDSCHMVRGLGIKSQPRRLLEGIGNLELVEMEDSDVCCGGAGAFSITQQTLSKQILGHKVENVVATSTDAVVSGCHGCNLQLADGLARANAPVRTIHTIQLLERAYRESTEEARPS